MTDAFGVPPCPTDQRTNKRKDPTITAKYPALLKTILRLNANSSSTSGASSLSRARNRRVGLVVFLYCAQQ